jgi:hypothetical protein
MRKSLLVVVSFLVACVPPANQQPAYGPSQPQPQQGQYAQQQAQQGPSGCVQLLSCFQGCGQDGQCVQTCLGQSDATSQAQVTAMMQCSSDRCNGQGSECMQAQCNAEVSACYGAPVVAQADPAPAQQTYQQPAQPSTNEVMKPGQPHTTANLLPWLQQGDGQWIGTNHQFTFYPDGRVRRASGAAMYTDKGTYGCVSVINDEGTVRQEGDQLIMEFETEDQNHCGHKDKGAALTVRYQITWYQYGDLPVNLLLVDLTCTRDSMYCNNQMRKR